MLFFLIFFYATGTSTNKQVSKCFSPCLISLLLGVFSFAFCTMSEILSTDFSKNAQLSEIEVKILQRYQSLAKRLNELSQVINRLVEQPTPQLLENLRVIESKIALVFTLFKAAVYSLFLQQEGVENQEMLQESTSSFIQ